MHEVTRQPVVKDTVRIILFLECNMSCSYCCNEQEQFSSQFQKKSFDEIDFSLYKNVCISGGEPFLKKDLLYNTLKKIPPDKKIFIYTNGTKIDNTDIFLLLGFNNLKAINVGLHHINQLKNVNEEVDTWLPVRFMLQDKNYHSFKDAHPGRLSGKNIKLWKMNRCNMPNEDWILLKQTILPVSGK